jgi:CubicO group peptidase (beta-lactamase class C family)
VYVGGAPVVRLTGGSRIVPGGDAAPYDDRTIQLVASTTKFVESLCVMLLVDRGLVRYDDRVVDHWPEFAGGHAGKERVTIRQLMMHRAGLPVFDRKLGDEELFDLDARARFSSGRRRCPSCSALSPRTATGRRSVPLRHRRTTQCRADSIRRSS